MKRSIVISLLVVAVLVIGALSPKRPRDDAPSIREVNQSQQPQRKQWIDARVAEGYWHKVTHPGVHPRVYATSSFLRLDVDTKQTWLSVVAAYYNDDVLLYDAVSGRQVGRFDTSTGLTLY